MNPYRHSAPFEPRTPRRKRFASRREVAFVLLAMIAGFAVATVGYLGAWTIGVCGCAVAVAFAIVLSGRRSRVPLTRLCALQWNRGDRLGAMLLFFNVIEPRYSAKRIARNKAALEAAQMGMPKYRIHVIPFVGDDE